MPGITKHYKKQIRDLKPCMIYSARKGTRGPSGKENGRQLKKIWKHYFIWKLSSQRLLSAKHLQMN